MADECDLEELTAFLEASDCEDEITQQEQKIVKNTDNSGDSKTEIVSTEKTDDCSLDEIEAFLQASDNESDSADEKDMEREEKIDCDADTNKDKIDIDHDAVKKEADFDDLDEADMEHLEHMLNSDVHADNSGNQSTTCLPEKQDTEKSVEDEVEDESNEKGPVGDADTETIKAEMAAMAERMKQLEKLLNKSQSGSNKSEPRDKHRQNDNGSSSRPSERKTSHKSPSRNKVTENSSEELVKDSPSRSNKSEPRDKHRQNDKGSSSRHKERKSSHKSPSRNKVTENSSKELVKDYQSRSNKSEPRDKHRQNDKGSSCSPSERKSSHKSPSRHKVTENSSKELVKDYQSRSNKSEPRDKHRQNDKGSSGSPSERKSSHKSPSCNKVTENSSKELVKDESEKTDQESYSNKLARAMSAHKHSKSTLSVSDKNPVDFSRTKLKATAETDTDEENPFFASTKQRTAQTASSESVMEPEITSKSLFGDSDDSDWDDLGGDQKDELSKEGKDLQKLITSGNRKREAHTPSYDPSILKKPDLGSWSEKSRPPIRLNTQPGHAGLGRLSVQPQLPALNPETGTVSGKYRVKDEYMPKSTLTKEDERESVTDPFCGIRIINPRISMSEFKLKMAGRNMIRIPKLLSRYNKSDLQKDNWVTVGVVVHKTEPRQSAAGKAYCIWKISDIQDCDKTVTFFLFGNVYKEHWKNDLGVVIGLLNPSFMDKAEKNQSEVAITIQHPQQLLMLGISKDLGRCRSTTKAGHPCSSFINKQQGEFCTYHVQTAYRKSSSKRTELQASTGVTPKNFATKKLNSKNDGFFFYGGTTYTTMRPQVKSSKEKMTLKKLQTFEAGKSAGKITTMSLHELEAEDEKKINKLAEKDKQLLSMLSVPSAGSMNFVKHLVKKDATKSFVNQGESGDEIAPLVSAKDLLKEHTKTIIQKKRETSLLSATPTIGKGFTCGQQISLDVPIKKKVGSASAEFAKQLAIAKIKAKGGLKTEDPNAVRKKVVSPEAREKIKKRVAEAMDPSPSKDSGDKEPPKKKSKLLGDLDLNSPEVQQLLKKKSKHTGALAEAEAEHEDRYFSALEQKEKMEDKMSAIMEVPVKLVYCVQCKYRYFSAHERCKKENHTIKYTNGVKRFFRCKQCKKRTICLDKIPTTSCQQCGTLNFERVSMWKEKTGPKLESEELCLRGNEQKFIGSLQGKASFNG